MKKVLIIGSSGYIGSQLYDYLENCSSIQVTGCDNYLYGNTYINKKKNKKIINKDIRDIDNKFLEKYDAVICLSALSNNPIDEKNKKKIYDITKFYTANFAKKIAKIGNKLIFPSSCSVYGNSKAICYESTKTNPLTFYSKNKVEIENILKNYNQEKNLNCIILRPATVFGISPSIRFDLVINMLIGMSINDKNIKLNSNGLAKRPFIHILDLCQIFKEVLFYEKKNFQIINAGNNFFNYSILEVAKMISLISKKKLLLPSSYKNMNLKKIHKDDLIVNNQDSRSYFVNFDLASNILKIKYKNNFTTLLNKTFIDIKDILKENNFNSKNFYRLNKIKFLINSNKINEKTLRLK